MRSWIVATIMVVTLLASAAAAQAFDSPWKADFAPADRLPVTSHDAGAGKSFRDPAPVSPFSGFTSVDFLGQIRRQLDFGRLIGMFPFSWIGGRSASAVDMAKYLGFTYERADASPPSSGLYYTGEEYDGRHIYVPAAAESTVVPGLIFLKGGDRYTAYAISGKPPVYAYVLYGAFNAGETVRFGLANEGGGTIDLRNAAPYEIQRNDNGTWRTVFSPVAAQVIVPLPNGTYKEWQWKQRLNDESPAPFGDYRVLVSGKYATPFRIAPDVPAVGRSDASYDRFSVAALASSSPVPGAFEKAYPSAAGSLRDDVIGIMQYKAWALDLDPGKLRTAIDAEGAEKLPCLAIHASFEGQPAWIILSCNAGSSQTAPAADVYVVNDASGSIAYEAPAG